MDSLETPPVIQQAQSQIWPPGERIQIPSLNQMGAGFQCFLHLQGAVHINEFQQVKRPKEGEEFSEEMYKSWKQRELRSSFRKELEQMLFGRVHREVMGFSQQHTSSHMCPAGTEETSWVLKWARLSFSGLGRRKPLSSPVKSTDFGYTLSHISNCNLKSMFIQ